MNYKYLENINKSAFEIIEESYEKIAANVSMMTTVPNHDDVLKGLGVSALNKPNTSPKGMTHLDNLAMNYLGNQYSSKVNKVPGTIAANKQLMVLPNNNKPLGPKSLMDLPEFKKNNGLSSRFANNIQNQQNKDNVGRYKDTVPKDKQIIPIKSKQQKTKEAFTRLKDEGLGATTKKVKDATKNTTKAVKKVKIPKLGGKVGAFAAGAGLAYGASKLMNSRKEKTAFEIIEESFEKISYNDIM